MPNLNCLPFMILLTNCWLLWSLNENITSSIEENAFRNGFCKMSTIFSQLSFNMLIDLMWMYFGIDIHVSLYIYIYIPRVQPWGDHISSVASLFVIYFICCISLCYRSTAPEETTFHLLLLFLLQEYSPRGTTFHLLHLSLLQEYSPGGTTFHLLHLFVTGVQPPRRPRFICCISLLQEYSPRGDYVSSVASFSVAGVPWLWVCEIEGGWWLLTCCGLVT